MQSVVWTALLGVGLLLAPAHARADEGDDDSKDCEPACRLGYECVKGECKKAVCRPACRSGFVCIEGECKSNCNPPCASNERCASTADGYSCVRMSKQRADDDENDATAKTIPPKEDDEKTDDEEPKSKPEKYKPSTWRVYVGPIMFAIAPFGPVLADAGGTVAINGAPDDAGVFFVGVRLMSAGDSSGVVFTGDLDFGARPRLFENGATAVAVVLAGGIGGGVLPRPPPRLGFFTWPHALGSRWTSTCSRASSCLEQLCTQTRVHSARSRGSSMWGCAFIRPRRWSATRALRARACRRSRDRPGRGRGRDAAAKRSRSVASSARECARSFDSRSRLKSPVRIENPRVDSSILSLGTTHV